MQLPADQQLADELQELYLQNKEWFSRVLFLEDETRFLNKLYEHIFCFAIQEEQKEQINHLKKQLTDLTNNRIELKKLILEHQEMIGNYIKDPEIPFSLDLIEDHTNISNQINQLFKKDAAVKKEVFSAAEPLLE